MYWYKKSRSLFNYITFFFRYFFMVNATTIFGYYFLRLNPSNMLISNGISSIIYAFICKKENIFNSYLSPNFLFLSSSLLFILSKYNYEYLMGAFISYIVIHFITGLLIYKFGYNWLNIVFPSKIISLILIVSNFNILFFVCKNIFLMFKNYIWNFQYDFVFLIVLIFLLLSVFLLKHFLFTSIWLSAILGYIIIYFCGTHGLNNLGHVINNIKLFSLPKLFIYPKFDLNIILPILPFSIISIIQHINCFYLMENMKHKRDLKNNPDLLKSLLVNNLVDIISVFFGSIPFSLYNENINSNFNKKKYNRNIIYIPSLVMIIFSFISKINFFIYSIPSIIVWALYIVLCISVLFSGLLILFRSNIYYNLQDLFLFAIVTLISVSNIQIVFRNIIIDNIMFSIISSLTINLLFKFYNYMKYKI